MSEDRISVVDNLTRRMARKRLLYGVAGAVLAPAAMVGVLVLVAYLSRILPDLMGWVMWAFVIVVMAGAGYNTGRDLADR